MSVLKYALTQSRENIHKSVKKYLGEPITELWGAYAVWSGDIQIALVCHIDTVLEHSKRPLSLKFEKNKISGRFGVGADDRAGIAMILQILRNGLKPWVILCDDEEVGGLGASSLAESVPNGFDLSAMIELDRRGSNDAVYYDMDLDTADAAALRYFIEYRAGYVKDWGSFSDISVLAPAWEVAAVNLSVGYYNEHTANEYLTISEWRHNIERVSKILTEMKDVGRLEYTMDEASYAYNIRDTWNKIPSKKSYADTSGRPWDDYSQMKEQRDERYYKSRDVCWCGVTLIEGYCPNCDRYPYLGPGHEYGG